MIRSHYTKAGSFSCAGEKFSTLAETVAFVESPEGAELGEITLGFRFRKRIRHLALNLGKKSASLNVGGNGLATSVNERRASAKTSGLLGIRIS